MQTELEPIFSPVYIGDETAAAAPAITTLLNHFQLFNLLTVTLLLHTHNIHITSSGHSILYRKWITHSEL